MFCLNLWYNADREKGDGRMNGLRNLRFRTKIILVCVVILLLNSVICGSLYYNYVFKDTLKNYYSTSEDMVSQMRMQLTSETQSITKRVHAIYNNPSFYGPMSQYIQDRNTVNYAKLLGDISDSITEFSQGDRYIHSVSIEMEGVSFDNFTRIRNHDFRFMESSMHAYFVENPNATICWYPAMTSPAFKSNETVIPVVYRFRISREDIYVLICLQQSEIEDFLGDTYSSYDGIFIADRDNQNILNCGEQELQVLDSFSEEELENRNAICKEVEIDGETYLATYTVMNGTGWKICALRSAESLLGNLEQLRYFIILMTCICTIVSIVVIAIMAHGITAPLGQLSVIMNQVTQEENFENQFIYPYHDEVGKLSVSFNYMIEKINHLIMELNANIEALKEEKENVKIVQMQKRKAELKALQAQINPHFLYNTLNAITWQAADQGANEISTMSNSLGKFFRISLSKGKEIITIREELEHVLSYLRIQGIRYKDKISYEFDAPEDVKELYIIKLVLQPLVENAIYHGIKVKEGAGQIRIAIRRGVSEANIQILHICVEDDGVGIEEERLSVIREGLRFGYVSQDGGYGIYNVNERIKLYYGDSYGLAIESEYGKGTRATIVIPVCTMEEEG